MTGYGRGLAEGGGHRIAVEIRSVNHRFMDLKVRGGPLDPGLEERLTSRVRKRVSRGSLSVTVRLESTRTTASVRLDLAAARRAYEMLRELSDALKLTREIGLPLICQQPGVLTEVDETDHSEELAEVATEATEQAIDALLVMRDTEGRSLKADLLARLARLRELTGAVERSAASVAEEMQRRLKERLARLLQKAEVSVDEGRLAQEVAVLADRMDVTEELVRLKSHLEQVAVLMETPGAVGRRLDFLVQELGREFNTVASKCQSAGIANLIVEAKAELEKVREQVQNIE
jgi:uncharacterized protein (TIGR00255 family)